MIQKIIILGGGAAGWLAANHLGRALNTASRNDLTIQLVESPNIPTIGVGEGTVPMMRETLAHFGIRETDFFTRCDATFKQSIQFVDWMKKNELGESHRYHHLFDYPAIQPLDTVPYWLLDDPKQRACFAESVSSQGMVCDAGLAPKLITHPEYQGFFNYAYHLDAHKFSQLLAANAKEKFAVQHILADVRKVNLDEQGKVRSLLTEQAGELVADFFVDCSGFVAKILGESLQVKFIDRNQYLFVDHALAIQIPYLQPDAPIPSHTIATAQDAGWIWDIGLTTRRGVGYVYSSDFTSHQQAEKTLRTYIGSAFDHIDCRRIPMRIGHREHFWVKNCVAIGLAQGFVEPLEATGLLLFDATAKMLAELLPSDPNQLENAAKLFNQRALHSWQCVLDFIKLHYCISDREDNDFWLKNRDPKTVPDSLLAKLELWQTRAPNSYDFFSRFETFNLDNYLYVLYGMNYQSDLSGRRQQYSNLTQAKRVFSSIQQQSQRMCQQLESNRTLIEKIHRYGMQKC